MQYKSSAVVVLATVGILFTSLTSKGESDPSVALLSPLALLNRCYSQLTQTKLALTHPLVAAVNNGMNPVDACLSLIDAAALQPQSGPTEGKIINSSADGLAVLKTMNDFHRTWFPNDNFINSITDLYADGPRESLIYDAGEPALFITRALLTPGVSFSEAVTIDSGMEALRTSGEIPNAAQPAYQGQNQYFIETNGYSGSGPTPNPLPAPIPIPMDLVQSGDLLGVRKTTSNPNRQNVLVTSNGYYAGAHPLFNSLGGGIIGSRTHIMLNWGDEFLTKPDGGINMNRNWSKVVFSDLLCRSLPTLRATDALDYVETTTTASTPPFRSSATCMSCHASVDAMAGTVRNFALDSQAAAGYIPFVQDFDYLYVFTPTQPAQLGQVDTDPLFYLRPPTGKLFYRSLTGALIDQPVTGPAGLGQAISQTDDFYACAASRYLQFFTGIQANLQDPGDPANPPLAQEDIEYRNLVIQLGQNLKNHQTLRTTVQEILQSNIYQTTSMRNYGAVPSGGN